jgi:cobalamin biosynthesis Mg chelatase CobN
MTRALVASTLAAALLAVAPVAALAQDAGGQQYDDPLADTPSAPSTPSTPSPPATGSTTSAGGTGTTSSSAGTTSGSSTGTSTATATTATAATAAAGTGEIPRTGFPVGWLTFAGFLALGGGFALRRAAGFQAV